MTNHNHAVLKALDGEIMPLMSVTAQGTLAGALFEMAVAQRYRNPRNSNIEALYTFPLATGAVLLGIEFEINGKTLTGTAVEKQAAQTRYEDALEDGDSAILLEKTEDGLYTVNLGNLMAGEDAVIRYRYAQLLTWDQGRLRLVIPTTIAPRYGSPEAAGIQPHAVPVADAVVSYPFSLEIAVLGELASRTIASPSHALATRAIENGLALSLQQATLDRDVVLTVVGGSSSAVHVAPDGEGWVALAAFSPAMMGAETDGPLSLRLVIDCSGSMVGDSIDSARRGGLKVIESLRPEDEFSITRFGSHADHLYDRLKPADGIHMTRAALWLNRINADLGGTEMDMALKAATGLPSERQTGAVLLITDGEVWQVDALIDSAKRSGQRYFVVGVGSSPSHATLERLALETGGSYEAVIPGEDIESAILRQFGRMRQSRASQLRLIWPSSPMWATELPKALFKSDTLHGFAGFIAEPQELVRLQYTLDDGTVLEERAPVVRWPSEAMTLARIAAAVRINRAGNSLTKRALTDLAVAYNLVSDHTHYLVIHERAEGEKADDLPVVAKVRQMEMLMAHKTMGISKIMQHKSNLAASYDAIHQDIEFEEVGFDGPWFDDDRPTVWRNRRGTGQSYADRHVYVASFLGQLDQRLSARLRGGVITRVSVLEKLGLPVELILRLQELIAEGNEEGVVVMAFLHAMKEAGQLSKISSYGQTKVNAALAAETKLSPVLVARIREVLDGANLADPSEPGLEEVDIPAFLRRGVE